MPQTQKKKNDLLKARRAEEGITRRSYWGTEQDHLKYRKIEKILLVKTKKAITKKKS